jgi:Domain of unknown function (DUF4314)
MNAPPPGSRVELISSSDEYSRLRPGAKGWVSMIDALGTVHVKWDDGSSLGLIPGEDRWKTLRTCPVCGKEVYYGIYCSNVCSEVSA